MSDGGIGSVSVSVVPDASGFWREFQARTQSGADNAGRQLGDAAGRAMGERIAELLNATLRGVDTGRQGKQAGQKYGDQFGREVTTRINAAMRAIGKVKVDANTAPAEAELQKLRVQIGRLGSGINVGRLDDKQALAQIKTLQAQLDKIGRKSDTAKIRVDTAAAMAQLAALQAQIKGVDSATQKASSDTAQWGSSFKPIIDSALLLGPALLPITAAAGAAGGALAGMGAAGIIAVLGVKNAMKDGTVEGQKYSGLVQTLQGNLRTLETTAASHVLQPFTGAVQTLQGHMKFLNQEVGGFSTLVGGAAQSGVDALFTLFQNLSPLINTVAQQLKDGADALDRWAHNGGLTGFASYAQSVLPQVEQTIKSVAQAFGHVVTNLGPLGGAGLTALKTLADIINSIPPQVITGLATAFVTLRTAALGLRVLSTVASGIRGVGAAASTVGAKIGLRGGAGLAAGLGIMGGAAVVAGLGIYALTNYLSDNAKKSQQAAQDYQNYYTALQNSNGAITDAVSKQVVQNATSDGTIERLKKMGISTVEWTNAVEGVGGALNKLYKETMPGGSKENDKLFNELNDQYAAFKKAAQAEKDFTDANTANNKALAAANPALAAQAKGLGDTVSALKSATDAAKKNAQSEASNTLQMQLENDAAGLLQQALDRLHGNTLGVAQAQTAMDSATLTATSTLAKNGTTIADNTQKGIANRQALEGQASAAINYAEQVGKQTGSTDKANAAIATSKQRLLDQLAAQHLLTPAVQAYIDKLYKIPPAKKTKIDLQQEAAAAKLATWKGALASLPQTKTTTAYMNATPAKLAINDLNQYIATHIPVVNVRVNASGVKMGYVSGLGYVPVANGGILDSPAVQAFVQKFSAGGIVSDKMRAGIQKFAEGHTAQIAPAGAMRLWAEPETGGEAYIPLAASKRSRSMAIWEETGRRLHAFADGGFNGASRVSVGAPIVQVTVMLDGKVIDHRADVRIAQAGQARALAGAAGLRRVNQ